MSKTNDSQCSGDFFLDDTAKRFPRKEEFIEAAKECFK